MPRIAPAIDPIAPIVYLPREFPAPGSAGGKKKGGRQSHKLSRARSRASNVAINALSATLSALSAALSALSALSRGEDIVPLVEECLDEDRSLDSVVLGHGVATAAQYNRAENAQAHKITADEERPGTGPKMSVR